jgi:carbon storage regulator
MLVLARKRGDSIRIAGGITVKVIEVVGGKVRLGVTAPRDVDVWRAELDSGSDDEKRDAA